MSWQQLRGRGGLQNRTVDDGSSCWRASASRSRRALISLNEGLPDGMFIWEHDFEHCGDAYEFRAKVGSATAVPRRVERRFGLHAGARFI